MNNKKEYILCAAISFDDTIIAGYRHDKCFAILKTFLGAYKPKNITQGFLTSKNRFVDRYEANKIAINAKQIKNKLDWLVSEDLY